MQPEPASAPGPDKTFGFLPGNGVHDIRMNQGNSQRFRQDDGVWQDGGLLLHYPAQGQWVAIFLAFQSQAWHTDDQTGPNRGGLITLLNPAGLKVDGVAYTQAQAAAEGWSIIF
jgi:uncharacterized protein YukJ